MKLIPTIACIGAVSFAAYAAVVDPYATVGPWEIVMPELPQTSCLASRIYDDTIFSFAVAPDGAGNWSIWFNFYSPSYTAALGQQIPAVIRLGDTETLKLTGSADGQGLVFFWTAATRQVLSALETSAWLSISTKTDTRRYPLDGIDAAMSAVQECWTEKQRREGIAM